MTKEVPELIVVDFERKLSGWGCRTCCDQTVHWVRTGQTEVDAPDAVKPVDGPNQLTCVLRIGRSDLRGNDPRSYVDLDPD
jgi:hypothetical protein